MKYKPNENELIGFLYGELSENEKDKVENYFQQHPEDLKQLRQLAEVRGIMSRIKDKEVIAPPVFVDENPVRPLWQSNYFRISIGIAAALMLVLVGARLLGLQAEYSGNELRIGFGLQPVVTQDLPLTSGQVQEMIEHSLSRNNESMAVAWEENQKKLDQSIHLKMAMNSKRIDDMVKATSTASQEEVRQFVAGLRNENLQLMQDYVKLSSGEQKQYIESLLVDFSEYLKEQRNQDLQMLQTKVSSLEQNSNQFREETAQILTSLISNGSSGSTIKRN